MQRGQSSCIEWTLDRMYARFDHLYASCDPNALFALTSIRVTGAIRRSLQPRFYDERRFLRTEDRVFAHGNRDMLFMLDALGLRKPDGSSRKPDHDRGVWRNAALLERARTPGERRAAASYIENHALEQARFIKANARSGAAPCATPTAAPTGAPTPSTAGRHGRRSAAAACTPAAADGCGCASVARRASATAPAPCR